MALDVKGIFKKEKWVIDVDWICPACRQKQTASVTEDKWTSVRTQLWCEHCNAPARLLMREVMKQREDYSTEKV